MNASTHTHENARVHAHTHTHTHTHYLSLFPSLSMSLSLSSPSLSVCILHMFSYSAATTVVYSRYLIIPHRVDLTGGCYDGESRGVAGKGGDGREGCNAQHHRGWMGADRSVGGRNGYLSIT